MVVVAVVVAVALTVAVAVFWCTLVGRHVQLTNPTTTASATATTVVVGVVVDTVVVAVATMILFIPSTFLFGLLHQQQQVLMPDSSPQLDTRQGTPRQYDTEWDSHKEANGKPRCRHGWSVYMTTMIE